MRQNFPNQRRRGGVLMLWVVHARHVTMLMFGGGFGLSKERVFTNEQDCDEQDKTAKARGHRDNYSSQGQKLFDPPSM